MAGFGETHSMFTTIVQLVGIIGGYLLLRPYLQQVLGVLLASDHPNFPAGDPPNAQMPEVTSKDRAAERRQDDGSVGTEGGNRVLQNDEA